MVPRYRYRYINIRGAVIGYFIHFDRKKSFFCTYPQSNKIVSRTVFNRVVENFFTVGGRKLAHGWQIKNFLFIHMLNSIIIQEFSMCT